MMKSGDLTTIHDFFTGFKTGFPGKTLEESSEMLRAASEALDRVAGTLGMKTGTLIAIKGLLEQLLEETPSGARFSAERRRKIADLLELATIQSRAPSL